MMTDDRLTRVEEKILSELLAYHASRVFIPAARTNRFHPAGVLQRSRLGSLHSRGRVQTALGVALAATCLALPIALIARLGSRASSAALAATPKPLHYMAGTSGESARDVLAGLATAAAHQPRSAAPSGRYAYIEMAGWGLATQVRGDRTSSTITSGFSESWLAPNGSGWLVSRKLLNSDTPLRGIQSSPVVAHMELPAGMPLLRLSTDPAILARQLATGHPAENGPAERFIALTDLAGREPIPFPVEAVILRDLADIPGLMNSGTVIDRAGRSGVAVSLDSAYSGALTRYTLIFAPRTGRLLGQEQTLIGDSKGLNVRPGSVISYTTFLAAGYVANVSSRPSVANHT